MARSNRMLRESGIFLLKDRVDCLLELAQWLHAEWYAEQNCDLSDAVQTMVQRINDQTLPVAFVAIEGGAAVGMVSVAREETLVGSQSPCLVGLYVVPTARGRGLGTQLCRRAIQFASQLNFDSLYLYTPDRETFYGRLGWQRLGAKFVDWEPRECIFMGLKLDAFRSKRTMLTSG